MQSVRILLTCVLAAICSNTIWAQSIKIKSLYYKDSKINVVYDLADSVEGRFYSIRVYSSADNFLNPLQKIDGEVGLEIKPGKDKVLTWSYQEELPPGFAGKVSLEIRAKIFVPFINTESINQFKVFKRKRKYNLTWSGGTPQNVMNFDLLLKGKKVATFPNIANVGHHSFEFPAHIKPAKNYRLRISDTKNHDEVVSTHEFRIKRKIPLVAKVVPAIALIAGVAILVQSKSAEPDLPSAPGTDRLPRQ